MFAKAIAIAAVTGFVAANQAPITKQDEGFMAGAMSGVMMTSEKDLHGCKRPHIPDMVKQAETMIPMLDMMAKQMNEGKEPAWMVQLKDSEHTIAVLASMVIGEYKDTEFCRGEIMAFEGKKIAMVFAGELFKQASAFLF